MRAVRFAEHGGPDVLNVVEVPRPGARPGQVEVAVVAAATNPGEIGIREGHFAAIWPAHFPEGQGNDLAGYITEVGAGVHDFAIGDEVLGFAPRMAQAEYVVLSVDAVAPKPPGLAWEAAATIAGAGATAWAAVSAVNPQPGETVVVSGAAGGVGIYAAQLARLRGADVIGTCGEANFGLLTSLGIRPVEYGPGLSRRLRELAPKRIDGYIDTFGSDNVSVAVGLGVAPNRINTLIDQDAVQRFGVHSDAQEQANVPRIWAELADLVARNDVTVPIAAVYDFTTEQVRQAYRAVGTRHVSGKRVLRVVPAPLQVRHT